MQFAHTEIMNCSSQCESEAHAVAELRQVEKDLRDELDSAHIAYQLEENDAVSQRAHFELKVAAERERFQRAEDRATKLSYELGAAKSTRTTEAGSGNSVI